MLRRFSVTLLLLCAVLTQWTTLTSSPKASESPELACSNEHCFLCGSGVSATLHVDTDAWTTVSHRPINRRNYGLVSTQTDRYIAVCGYLDSNTVHHYALLTDTWTALTSTPIALHNNNVDTDGTFVWSAAGKVGGASVKHFHRYTLVQDSWTTLPPSPTNARGPGVVYASNTVYVFGGGGPYMDAHSYTHSSDTWTTLADMPTPRYTSNRMVIAWGGIAYLIGAAAGNAMHSYTFSTDSYVTLDSLPTPVDLPSVASLGRFIYVVGSPSTRVAHRYTAPLIPWTTVSSVPETTLGSCAVALDANTVLFVSDNSGVTATYAVSTDVWTTVATKPSPGIHIACASLPIASPGIFVAGGAASTTVEQYRSSSGWQAKATLPRGLHHHGMCGDGVNTIWSVGGTPAPENIVWAYTISQDAWTTLTPMPTPRYGHGVSYTMGEIVAVGSIYAPASRLVEVYTVSTAIWRTVSPSPAHHCGLYQLSAALAGFVFVLTDRACPASPTNDFDALESYDILADTWTTLSYAPKSHYSGVAVLLPSGILVAIGEATNKWTHTYTDPTILTLAATIKGDPILTAFDGTSHHLDLHTGVFHVLSTPSLVVNALVEHFPHLPPEESTVMTMIGAVGSWQGCMFLVYTAVSSPDSRPFSRHRSLSCFGQAVATPLFAGSHVDAVTPATTSDRAEGITPTTASDHAEGITPTTDHAEAVAFADSDVEAVTTTTASDYRVEGIIPSTAGGNDAEVITPIPMTAGGDHSEATTPMTAGGASESDPVGASSPMATSASEASTPNDDHSLRLRFDDVVLDIIFNRLHYVSSGVDSAYLDLVVRARASTTTAHTGLLPDLSTRGVAFVRDRLAAGDYDIEDGCLFFLGRPGEVSPFHADVREVLC